MPHHSTTRVLTTHVGSLIRPDPMPIQDRMHGTDRRTLHIGMLAAQPLADLRSTPARVFLLELDDGLLDLKGELAGMAVGSSGAIRQPLNPTVLVP